ncbi:MAG: aminotransferase class I/II-fold pyridoxal phosphate-dependent enzyme [Flavobacteriaceae bacterium]|nr:MAG: aminotransferase class I/II-fold pyridoxal phosphate-dependent enzyme [Flavobacteriaceae bacterium]
MILKLTSKLPKLETSIFSKMSQMATETGAINLSQGFPDFGVDPGLIKLMQQSLEGSFNQYAPMGGIFSLREAIAEKTSRLYGASYHPETEITLTAGATQAIYTAIASTVYAGDEVIIFKPAYDCYEPTVKAHGGIPVLLQLEGPEFKINWEAFSMALSPRTRMVIINTPHNPSGTILKETDLKKLEEMLRPTNILVLSDEVYEHLVFDGNTHESACKYPGLKERSFICASFGKTFHITGWKMGYCLAPSSLMEEFRKLHEFVVFSVNHPAQRALKVYLEEPSHYEGLGAFFQKKRDLFLEAVRGSRFRYTPAEGTYFQLLEYSGISEESDLSFAEYLTRERGIASIPISVFNLERQDNRQLRFCFAKTEETLKRAGEILCRL